MTRSVEEASVSDLPPAMMVNQWTRHMVVDVRIGIDLGYRRPPKVVPSNSQAQSVRAAIESGECVAAFSGDVWSRAPARIWGCVRLAKTGDDPCYRALRCAAMCTELSIDNHLHSRSRSKRIGLFLNSAPPRPAATLGRFFDDVSSRNDLVECDDGGESDGEASKCRSDADDEAAGDADTDDHCPAQRQPTRFPVVPASTLHDLDLHSATLPGRRYAPH